MFRGQTSRNGFNMVSWSCTRKSNEQEKNVNVSPTVANWCPALDLWYTMGKRGSSKRMRVEEDDQRRFSLLLTSKELISSCTQMTSTKPICSQENNSITDRAACCDGDDNVSILSSDPAVASDDYVTNKFNLKQSKKCRQVWLDSRIPSKDAFEEESLNMVTPSQKEIEEDFLKMTGKTLPINEEIPCKTFLKVRLMVICVSDFEQGYFPGARMRRSSNEHCNANLSTARSSCN